MVLPQLKIHFSDPLSKVEEYYNNSLQLQNFGAKLKFINENLLEIRISHLTEIHFGGPGIKSVNGAVISYFFDLSLGLTAYMARDLIFQSSVTSRIEISFLKPLISNEMRLYAKIIQKKKNLIYSQTWIPNEEGKFYAQANGILFTK